MIEMPKHVAMDQFPIIEGELHVGSTPISRLAHRVGQTPFYAYDRSLVTKRVAYLRQSLPSTLNIYYAIKANPMPALIQHLATLVDGFDVASTGELKVALDTTTASKNISFAGPGKSNDELHQAVAAETTIVIESINELRRLRKISNRLGIKASAAIRINPNFELKLSGMKMGGGAQQFGIDEEHVPSLLQEINIYDINFKGFHIFCGSQNLNTSAIIESQKQIFELIEKLANKCTEQPNWINIGGGFGIPYFAGEKRLDLSPIGENLEQLITKLKHHLPHAQIITELGRYIVGEAGVYVSRIIDIKESRGETFIVTDGGMHSHIAASGNLGQIIPKNYPMIVGKITSGTAKTATITGKLCTPLDILGRKVNYHKADVGDLVIIFQSGAYGCSSSPTNFLSHPLPIEALV